MNDEHLNELMTSMARISDDEISQLLNDDLDNQICEEIMFSDKLSTNSSKPSRIENRHWYLLASAACLAVLAGVFVSVGLDGSEELSTKPAVSATPVSSVQNVLPKPKNISFDTDGIDLAADSIVITTPQGEFGDLTEAKAVGQTRWIHELEENSDDENFENRFPTKLELVWQEENSDGTKRNLEMHFEFKSNGTVWTLSDITLIDEGNQTQYSNDGTNNWTKSNVSDEQLEENKDTFPKVGEPLLIDVDLDNIKITGLEVTAFEKPEACTRQDSEISLISLVSDVQAVYYDSEFLNDSLIGFNFGLVNTADCSLSTNFEDLFVSATVEDTDVAEFVFTFPGEGDTPNRIALVDEYSISGEGYGGLKLKGEGETELVVQLESATGEIMSEKVIPIEVGPNFTIFEFSTP